ncbi:hypothetical protein JOC77_004362 [Peribacillus deserti]|uniref:Uncharacterized protein n=1 Tax=Peribacillus deserti TaxID=673318 RepID=A0ABS2QQZ0_9BACI|nr:hypothetical protein [Peribacillus deserti]MBM7694883.1 hypothetical protein [Peribacillus deserti]
MQIIATYEHSKYLELGITELQQNGITDIFAVPIKKVMKNPAIMDTIHHSDGRSFLDFGFLLAVVFSTILACRGLVWEWGPIYWGLIGGAGGVILGFLIEIVKFKIKNKDKKVKIKSKDKFAEVILIINCEKEKMDLVTDILTRNLVLGLAMLE